MIPALWIRLTVALYLEPGLKIARDFSPSWNLYKSPREALHSSYYRFLQPKVLVHDKHLHGHQ